MIGPRGEGARKKWRKPHALGYAAEIAAPCEVEAERVAVPSAGCAGSCVCRMHGARKGNKNAVKHGDYGDCGDALLDP